MGVCHHSSSNQIIDGIEPLICLWVDNDYPDDVTEAIMTEPQLKAEWEYRYAERLGILCADRQETFAQHMIAKAEADAAIAELRKEQTP